MEGSIPTLVVIVDGGLTMRTLDNLSRFVAGADAVPIVCFARTQHSMSIGYIFLIATILFFISFCMY